MSRASRYILAAVLALFTWMVLAGWDMDSNTSRAMDVAVATFMVLLGFGVLAPRRMSGALRIVAGMIALTYLAYFGFEVRGLLSGEHQVLKIGAPSALMAGVGLLVFGVPALIFALGGVTAGWVGRLFARARGDAVSDERES